MESKLDIIREKFKENLGKINGEYKDNELVQEVTKFISISPQPNVYDFTFLAPCPTSGQILYGDKDELVSRESLTELKNRLLFTIGALLVFRLGTFLPIPGINTAALVQFSLRLFFQLIVVDLV